MDITIKTEFIKLDQLLKFAGIVGNGSDAKILIAEEQIVKVNGVTEPRRGRKIYKNDVVTVGDTVINVR